APGHIRVGCFQGILHYAYAAVPLDPPEARSSIIQSPGQHDAGYAIPMGHRGGTEQGIYGRPLAVFFWTTPQMNLVVVDQKMQVGRRNVNEAGLNGCILRGLNRGERSAS